jgi:hypothetical protein
LNDNLSGLVSSADSIRSDFDIPAIDSVTGKNKFADFITSMRELKNNIKSFLNKLEKAESFVQKALNIARLTLNLMKMPSRMIINITEKVKGYSRLIAQIINQFKNDPYGNNKIKNSFASTRLVLSGAIASVSSGVALSIADSAARGGAMIPVGSSGGTGGSGDSGGGSGDSGGGGSGGGGSGDSGGGSGDSGGGGSGGSGGGGSGGSGGGDSGGSTIGGGAVSGIGAVGSGVLTREAAVAVAVQLKSMLRDIQDFEDIKIKKNNFIDSNASTYLLLVQLINKSIQLILTSCFALPMKRTIKLDRDRNFIELCAELYGTVDDSYLDRLIIENNLNVDELEIIPMGREVTYYVEST